MTKSEHPQGGGGFFAHPQQARNPDQMVPPEQAEQAQYNQGVQQVAPPTAARGAQSGQIPVGYGQPQPGQSMPPMPQQVAGQLPPPSAPIAHNEVYGEYPTPQQGQQGTRGIEPIRDPQVAPSYEAPMDEYQYPQGQAVLSDVPPVAVPPATHAPVDPMMQAQQPQMRGVQQEGADTGFGETAAINNAGEQISQRLAQLQSQYDEEISRESWGEAPAPNTRTPQHAEQFNPHQPVSEEFAGYAPEPYTSSQPVSPGEPFTQAGELAAHHYHEQALQAPQPSQQTFQEPLQAQQYAPPPLQSPHGSHEYAGPTPDSAQQPPGGDALQFAEGSSIRQEIPTGGGMKKVMFGGAFVAALAVGGATAYTYQYTDLFGSRSASGPAPTIKAGSAPVKFLKNKIKGAGDSINKAMHNRLSGTDVSNNSNAANSGLDKVAVVGRDGVELARDKISAARNGMLAQTGQKTSGSAIGENMPRRVKTLIVRPDGTILRPAGNEGGSSDKKAPIIGTGSAILPKSDASKTAGGNGIRRMKTIGEVSSARVLGANGVAPVEKTVRSTPKIQVVKKAIPPKPILKKPVIAKKPTVIANAAPVRNPGAIGKPFVVQVTSRSSQTSALAAFADMQQKYPNLIGAYQPDIQRANLGNKGIWYRLRVGPVGSKVAASDLCNNLKQAGHPGCFVRRK